MESSIAQTLVEKKLPLNAQQYEQLLNTPPKAEAILLNDRLKYLDNTYGDTYTKQYVKDSTYISFYYYDTNLRADSVSVSTNEYISNSCTNYAINIPEGYSRIIKVYTSPTFCEKSLKVVKVVPTFKEKAIDTVFVNLDTLRAYRKKMDAPIQLPCSTDKSLYYATSFSIESDVTDDNEEGYRVDVTGFMLQKK